MITHTLNHLSNCIILNNTHGDFDELLGRFGDYGIEADDDNVLYLLKTDAYFILDNNHLVLTDGCDEFFRYELKYQAHFDKVDSVLLINGDTPISDEHIQYVNQQSFNHASEFLYELQKTNDCKVEGFIIGFNA